MNGSAFVFDLEPLIDEAIERITAAQADVDSARGRLDAVALRVAEQRTVHDLWLQRASGATDELASALRTRCTAGALEVLDRHHRFATRRAQDEAVQLDALGSMRQAMAADLQRNLERLAMIEDELRGLRRLRERRCREHRRRQEAARERRLDDDRTCLAGRARTGDR